MPFGELSNDQLFVIDFTDLLQPTILCLRGDRILLAKPYSTRMSVSAELTFQGIGSCKLHISNHLST